MRHHAFFAGVASLCVCLLSFGVAKPNTFGGIIWAVGAGLWFLLWLLNLALGVRE